MEMNTKKASEGMWLQSGDTFVKSISGYGDLSGWTEVTDAYKTEYESKNSGELHDAIEAKLAEITEYDDCFELNSFSVYGKDIRLKLDLRKSLRLIINSMKANGYTGDFSEWYEGVCYTFDINAWDAMLNQYEYYAYQVECNTEQHKANVRALTDIDAIQAYDYKAGYPTKLKF